MRLKNQQKWEMRDKIIKDLYQHHEDAIERRKEQATIQNTRMYVSRYMEVLKQLPLELQPLKKTARMAVHSYFTTEELNNTDLPIDDVWKANLNQIEIVLSALDKHGQSEYSAYSVPVQPELQEVFVSIHNDDVILRKEKANTISYINGFINKYSGTLQLRRAMPQALHKYIPQETKKRNPNSRWDDTRVPVPLKNDAGPKSVKEIPMPDTMKIRMTNNMLGA